MTAVAANRQLGANVDFAVRRHCAHPGHAAAVPDQIDCLGTHAQIERPIAPRMIGEKIEEVPLRHQRNELALRRQALEMTNGRAVASDLQRHGFHLRMRKPEEFIEQAKLVNHFQRRGMNGIAAEIAQEILVLFQHRDADAGARQEEAEHHPGGAAAGDAAPRLDRVH